LHKKLYRLLQKSRRVENGRAALMNLLSAGDETDRPTDGVDAPCRKPAVLTQPAWDYIHSRAAQHLGPLGRPTFDALSTDAEKRLKKPIERDRELRPAISTTAVSLSTRQRNKSQPVPGIRIIFRRKHIFGFLSSFSTSVY